MRNAQQRPSTDDFRAFAASRQMLFAPTSAELSANVSALKAHAVYGWLTRQPAYLKAEASISKKKSFRSTTLPVLGAREGDYELLSFAMFVAQCLAFYFDLDSDRDNRKGVITSKDLQNATDAAAILRSLIERGLVLPGQSVIDLYTLLEHIPESTDGLLMTSKQAGSHVPTAMLIRMLALLLRSHYGEMMPTVIRQILSIVRPRSDPESLRRTIHRHLAELRGDT